MKIGILGAGSWGTALTVLLSDNGHDITVWSVDEKEIEMLDTKREHLTKLPGVKLPDSVRFTTDEQEVCKDAELLVMVVPSPFIRSTAKRVAPYITEAQTIVNVSKGIEDESLKTLTEVIHEEIPQCKVGVLSGPSHAEEVGKRMPTTVVAGAKDKKTALMIQDAFMNDYFRVYASPDVIGIELGGALKMSSRLRQVSAMDLAVGTMQRVRSSHVVSRKSSVLELRWAVSLRHLQVFPELEI